MWVDWSIKNWVTGFEIYAAIMVERYPALAAQLISYMSMIHGAASEFPGTAWLQYDNKFRQMKAVHPGVAWDQREINIWHAVFYSTAPANKINPSFRGDRGSGDKKQACWQFNKNECSRGTACRFKHLCSFCGMQGHPESKCYKKVGRPKSSPHIPSPRAGAVVPIGAYPLPFSSMS